MSKKTILHIVDLSMIGGKQEGALSVILSSPFRDKFNQTVFNTEKSSIIKRYKKKLLDNNIQSHEANILTPINNKLARKLVLLYTLIKVRPDIIILWSVLPSFALIAIRKLLNIQMVFWDRGVSSSRSPNRSIIFGLKRSDLILCNSEATKTLLEKKWSVDKAEVCHNAIRNDVIPENIPIKRLKKDSITLGFAGRLIPIKGAGLLIETVKILRDRGYNVRLLIAGEKNEEYNFLKKLSCKNGVEKYVLFLGNLGDMHQFYKKIDIFICPSLREPFGLVSVEAASNGCPVVISKIDGLAETIQDSVTGIAITPKMPITEYKRYASSTAGIPDYVYYPEKEDLDRTRAVYPVEIADSVEKMVQSEELFKKYSEASYKISIKKFSLDQHIHCVLKKLERLH